MRVTLGPLPLAPYEGFPGTGALPGSSPSRPLANPSVPARPERSARSHGHACFPIFLLRRWRAALRPHHVLERAAVGCGLSRELGLASRRRGAISGKRVDERFGETKRERGARPFPGVCLKKQKTEKKKNIAAAPAIAGDPHPPPPSREPRTPPTPHARARVARSHQLNEVPNLCGRVLLRTRTKNPPLVGAPNASVPSPIA
jgi:hypothetical protein